MVGDLTVTAAIENNALADRSFLTGHSDYHKGLGCIPCRSPDCMALIRDNNGYAKLILSEWSKGWNQANVNASYK